MIEQKIDLWQIDADVRCITTNGSVFRRRLEDDQTYEEFNPMGGGCARQAVDRYPGLDVKYAKLIKEHGHHVFLMHDRLVMFPTKEELRDQADLDTINRSCEELVALRLVYKWKKIAIPRPGSGLGGLTWEQVRPVCELWFGGNDAYIIVDFPG